MFLDGRTAEVPDDLDCDLAIVGAGPAGITLALELAGAGLDIVLIESGGFDFDAETQALYDGDVTALDTVDLTAIRLRLFGGASGHWGGQCLPLDDIDFDRAPPGFSGWPFGRAALDPFYEIACRYTEVGPPAFDPAQVLADPALPLAGDPRIATSVIRQSPPTRFGSRYRDAIAAQSGLRVLLWTNVTGAAFDGSGQVTTLRTQTLEGRQAQIRPRRVVIACGAVETARLLLQFNAESGQRYGDAGGLLGRCYMDHPSGGVGRLRLRRPLQGWPHWDRGLTATDGVGLRAVLRPREAVLAETGRLNAQFFLLPSPVSAEERARRTEAFEGVAALRDIAKWAIGQGRPGLTLSEAYCTAITSADALIGQTVRQVTSGDGVEALFVRYEAEQLPSRESFVALSPERDALGQLRTRLHWTATLAERESLIANAMALGAAFGAEGLGHLELAEEMLVEPWQTYTAWHQIGTTRLSVAPKDGVADPDGRLHGTRNLYCLGSGMMPTGGRANPTLTIVALAARMAAHLRQQAGG